MNRVLLVGAAPGDHASLDRVVGMRSFDAVFAVDGGYATLLERGIEPTEVFGDFDSLGFVPDHASAVFDWHKDFTDMDWALQHALDEGYGEAYLADALEGRLDHTLTNLQLMVKYARAGLKVYGLSGNQVAVALVAGVLDRLSFPEGVTGTFSLAAHANECVVTEVGFEWELDHAQVDNETSWGVSNELVGAPATVVVEQGSAWAFFPIEALPKVTYGSAC